MPLIELQTVIRASPERCCNISLDAEVHAGSMAHTSERAIYGRTRGIFELDDTVTWEARHFGIRQRLEVRITALNFPCHFRDEMVHGAFKTMRHDHYFGKQENHTLMRDEFYFESPLGIAGKLANRLFLTRYMRNLLLQRNAFIKSLAESADF